MHLEVDGFLLRMPEPEDIEELYSQKNASEIAAQLGGFTTGYSKKDLAQWMEYHRTQDNEALWVVAEAGDNRCVGHIGLYEIDHRIRSAEFAIMLGDANVWGQGLGRACTQRVIEYGFEQLNLNRIHLSVLESNERARYLYDSIGFEEEGRLRQAQYKSGRYLDVILMGLLRDGWYESDG
jgi:RimJ/RimL family protein N-acetyltransferase